MKVKSCKELTNTILFLTGLQKHVWVHNKDCFCNSNACMRFTICTLGLHFAAHPHRDTINIICTLCISYSSICIYQSFIIYIHTRLSYIEQLSDASTYYFLWSNYMLPLVKLRCFFELSNHRLHSVLTNKIGSCLPSLYISVSITYI